MLSTFGSDVALGTKENTFEPGDKWAAFLAADVASYCVSGGRHGDSLSFYRNKTAIYLSIHPRYKVEDKKTVVLVDDFSLNCFR